MTKNILYLDVARGASGDMYLGALVDLAVPFDLLVALVDSLKIPSLSLEQTDVTRGGIRACKVDVHLPHEHAHRRLHDIFQIIDHACLSEYSRQKAKDIFQKLAEAESRVHGLPPEEIHFHEVGAADSLVDILGTTAAMDWLVQEKNVSHITASPMVTGTGTVQVAHGLMTVPAPATTELLLGIPCRASEVPFELTTPTGAVLTTSFASGYGPLPSGYILKTGTGAGTRELPQQANVLRAILLATLDQDRTLLPANQNNDKNNHLDALPCSRLCLLQTNLDDATGEQIGFLLDQIQAAGPRDVWTTSISMKKQRPGVLISILCDPDQEEKFCRILFENSPTLGVRVQNVLRRELPRREGSITTAFGPVRGKFATLPDGSERFKPEYEEIRRIATEQSLPWSEVRRQIH